MIKRRYTTNRTDGLTYREIVNITADVNGEFTLHKLGRCRSVLDALERSPDLSDCIATRLSLFRANCFDKTLRIAENQLPHVE
jgi:hypothetical protein